MKVEALFDTNKFVTFKGKSVNYHWGCQRILRGLQISYIFSRASQISYKFSRGRLQISHDI